MKLTKRPPTSLSPFVTMGDDFNQLFQGFFRPLAQSEFPNAILPAVNVDEKQDKFIFSAELPGFDKEDIQVKMQNGILTLEAEHNAESKKEAEGNILNERRYESYFRSFNFGKNIAENDITASYKNGILKLDIPKLNTESKEQTRISIE